MQPAAGSPALRSPDLAHSRSYHQSQFYCFAQVRAVSPYCCRGLYMCVWENRGWKKGFIAAYSSTSQSILTEGSQASRQKPKQRPWRSAAFTSLLGPPGLLNLPSNSPRTTSPGVPLASWWLGLPTFTTDFKNALQASLMTTNLIEAVSPTEVPSSQMTQTVSS